MIKIENRNYICDGTCHCCGSQMSLDDEGVWRCSNCGYGEWAD